MNKEIVKFCLEIDRGGICEENLVWHKEFPADITKEEVVNFLKEEDIGWEDGYCEVKFYKV